MANSGGGVILFGLDSLGKPCEAELGPISALDPAEVADKISKYTGAVDLEFEIRELKKKRHNLVAFNIPEVSVPIVFRRPGTYDIGGGKQRTAFSAGTVYFRHGAKSEPGTTEDIGRAIERQLESIRKSWVKGVRKVVRAPQGSQVVLVRAGNQEKTSFPHLVSVRSVKDPNATPVLLTRDYTKASGTLVHEEISEGIFDEINNVVDANNLLAGERGTFVLGQPVYFRIYAERHHVQQAKSRIVSLLQGAVSEFYAPGLYWILQLPVIKSAQVYARLYLFPKSPQIHSLMRMAVLLGNNFANWLYQKWREKWERNPQPPPFYWTFSKMLSQLKENDPRFVAARVGATSQFVTREGSPLAAQLLLEKPGQAVSLLSDACMRVFQGASEFKSVARNLDYLAYGAAVMKRSRQMAKLIIKEIGAQQAADLIQEEEAD